VNRPHEFPNNEQIKSFISLIDGPLRGSRLSRNCEDDKALPATSGAKVLE